MAKASLDRARLYQELFTLADPHQNRCCAATYMRDLVSICKEPGTRHASFAVAMGQSVNKSPIVRWGKKLRPTIDAVVTKYSDDPTDAVLDSRDFPWTRVLRDAAPQIRSEASAVLSHLDEIPSLAAVSPDHAKIAPMDQWRSFFLYGYGNAIHENLERCPATAAVIAQIPHLNSAFFSILKPGTHIPTHRGVTKGLITSHLGLFVPPGDHCRMRVDDQIVTWDEGETLVFDDTFEHEVWNDTDQTRVVLLVQVERQAHFPGNLVAGAFLWGVRHSPFVRDGVKNLSSWNDNVKRLEGAFND